MSIRKNILLTVLLSMMMLILPLTVCADDGASGEWMPEDFTYGDYELPTDTNQSGEAVFPGNAISLKLSGTKRIVTGFSESGKAKLEQGNTDLVIPPVDDEGNVVQGVGKFAFNPNYNADMKSLGVKLTSVALPENIFSTEHLDYVKTNWAPYLSNKNIEELGDFFILYGAFGSNLLTEVTIPDGVLYVGDTAFSGNKQLTRVSFSPSVAVICARSFQQCAIDEAIFPEQTDIMISLGTNSFAGDKLTEVTLPKDTLQIMSNTFAMNTGSGVKVTNPSNAYEQVSEVVTVNLTLTDTIGLGQYIDTDTKVMNLVITEVKDEASHVHELVRHESVAATCTEDGVAEYYECTECGRKFSDSKGKTEVTDVTVPATGHDWDEGVVIKKPTESTPGETLYTCKNDPSHTRTVYIYPDAEWEPGDFTYDGSVITGLSESGQDKVTYLTDLVLPDTAPDGTEITEVGDKAFFETGITSIEYPAGLKKIGVQAFSHTQLTEAIIPDTVTEIGEGAYAMDWQLSKIVIPDSLAQIPDGAFNRQTVRGDHYDEYPSVGAIIIPDSVTYIGQSAFFGLGATSVKLPANLEEMGQSAFSNNKISEVNVPGTLKNIPRQAFAVGMAMYNNPVRLTSLTLHEGTETIGRNAFENSGLKTVSIPSTITSIDDTAFRVGMGRTDDANKIVLYGTAEQHLDKTLNTGTGYGHKFAPVVTFDSNGHESEPVYVVVDEASKIDEYPVLPDEECYEFTGWSSAADEVVEVSKDTEFTSDTTLYAIWNEAHDYIKEITKKPTATEDGIAVYTCSRNPEHTYTSVLPHFTDEEIEAIEAAQDDLTGQIVSANASLSRGSYTDASYKAAKEAISKANDVFDDPTATASDIKAAKAELMRALRTLEPVDQTAAQETKDRRDSADTLARTIIDVYQNVRESQYTASSYSALNKAVQAGEELLDTETATSAELDDANSAILSAWKGLKKKSSQPMTAKARTKTVVVKNKAIKKKPQTFAISKLATVKNAQGTKSYSIAGVNKSKKYFSINSKTGKLKIKKGLKKGTYKVKIKITAAGNGTYNAGSKTITVKIKVR